MDLIQQASEALDLDGILSAEHFCAGHIDVTVDCPSRFMGRERAPNGNIWRPTSDKVRRGDDLTLTVCDGVISARWVTTRGGVTYTVEATAERAPLARIYVMER